jgi:hypothetical protein
MTTGKPRLCFVGYLVPYFGKMALSEVTAGKVQEYRIHPRQLSTDKRGKPPSRSSMHHETVTIRQVLKTALRHGWLTALPDLSQPYKTSGKITHRAWFSPEEYQQLYEATRRRAARAIAQSPQVGCEQLHDCVTRQSVYFTGFSVDFSPLQLVVENNDVCGTKPAEN